VSRARLKRATPELLDPRGPVLEDLARAVQALREGGRLTDEVVHDVRKRLKRVRAGLRLLRESIGDEAYAAENRRVRDCAKALSAARDAAAALAAVDALLQKKRLGAHHPALRRFRRDLVERRKEMLATLGAQEAADTVAALERTLERASRWRMPRATWPIVGTGLRRIYRNGRRALAAADATGATRALHEARKQARYLEDALALLQPAQARKARKLARRAHAVARRLGDDHDLAVVKGMMARGRLERTAVEAVDEERRRLQKKALKRARKLFRRKPRRFLGSVGRSRIPAGVAPPPS